jgi:hypothetical protein
VGVSVSGFPAQLDLVPGDPATCEIVVRNTGTLVDDFTIELLGEANPWVQILPPALQLLPGTQGSVQLHLLPPRKPSPKAGPLPVHLRVVSKEDPENSATREAVLAVGAFGDVRAQLVPRTARHRRSAIYELTVSNQGNDVISAQVATSDPDNLLAFETVPPAVMAEPAAEAKVAIRARARKLLITGRAETRPFQTVVQDPRWPPVSLDGTLIQKPLLPWWLLLLVLASVVVTLALLARANPVVLAAIVGVIAAIVVAYRRKRRPEPPG